ncbi:MAG: LD-carboxypeptidase [Cellulophaga sp.]
MHWKKIVYFTFIVFFSLFSGLQAQNSSAAKELIQPPYLKAGDTVAIVAPSGILRNRKEVINKAVALLKSWKLHVVLGKNLYKQNGHFAGTDTERASDFQKALDDPKIKAIWCARGGYGSVRILDKLNYTKFKKKPKWVVGYSDITGLHNQIHNQGVASIHSIMCSSLGSAKEKIKKAIETFRCALFGEQLKYSITPSKYNKTGNTTGPIIGGNLTLLHTMLGSKTSIDTSGKILFIEELGEYAYHIDRMLQSLKRAGYFENCNGIIVGDIIKVRKNTTPFGRTVQQIILDAVAEYNFPVLFNFPAGHLDDNRALILGRTIQLKVSKESSSVIFSK